MKNTHNILGFETQLQIFKYTNCGGAETLISLA